MSGEHVEKTIAGVRVFTRPFDAMTALELGPEAAIVIAPMLDKLGAMTGSIDYAELGPAVMAMASQLVGGKLATLGPKLLATTRVVANGEIIDLAGGPEAINKAFRGDRLNALLGTIVFAAEVSFGRFFAGSGRPASSTPTTPPSP